jgi:hypothetical protein
MTTVFVTYPNKVLPCITQIYISCVLIKKIIDTSMLIQLIYSMMAKEA